MSAITVQIQRMHHGQPWGFRLQGGRDFREVLSIKKVTPGTPAAGQMHPGDAVVAIGSYDTSQLTHEQASQMIRASGNVLQLTLAKGVVRDLRPAGPVKFSPSKAYGYSGY